MPDPFENRLVAVRLLSPYPLSKYLFGVVGHRCGDALILADERSNVGARVLSDQNLAALVLVGTLAARQRRPTTLNTYFSKGDGPGEGKGVIQTTRMAVLKPAKNPVPFERTFSPNDSHKP